MANMIEKNNKSDVKKFCKTMWILLKNDVLPWVIGMSLLGGGIAWVYKDAEKQREQPQQFVRKINQIEQQNHR